MISGLMSRRGRLTASAVAIASAAMLLMSLTALADSDRHLTYSGPVKYTNNCNGPNSTFTSMDANGTQQACQVSYNGGQQRSYSDCSSTGKDQGTWTYTPSGQDAQYATQTYTGTYTFQFSISSSENGSGVYSGTETFKDPGVGMVSQRFSVPVTFDAKCNAIPSGNWYVAVKGTGGLSFLTGSTGTAPAHHHPPKHGDD